MEEEGKHVSGFRYMYCRRQTEEIVSMISILGSTQNRFQITYARQHHVLRLCELLARSYFITTISCWNRSSFLPVACLTAGEDAEVPVGDVYIIAEMPLIGSTRLQQYFNLLLEEEQKQQVSIYCMWTSEGKIFQSRYFYRHQNNYSLHQGAMCSSHIYHPVYLIFFCFRHISRRFNVNKNTGRKFFYHFKIHETVFLLRGDNFVIFWG